MCYLLLKNWIWIFIDFYIYLDKTTLQTIKFWLKRRVTLQGKRILLKLDTWTNKGYLRFILNLPGSSQDAQAIPMSLAHIWKTIFKIYQTKPFKIFKILSMIRLDWKTWKIQLFLKFHQFFRMFKTANLKTHLAKSIKIFFNTFWKMNCKWKTVMKTQKNKWAEKILQTNYSIKLQMMSIQIWTNMIQINAAKKILQKCKMKTWKCKDQVLC